MSQFNWPSLMRAGIGRLGMPPDAFWRLTPAELMIRLGQGQGGGNAPMGRSRLADLLRDFPDEPLARASDYSERTRDE